MIFNENNIKCLKTICFIRNFTRKNRRKDTLGLLPVVRDLRNGARGSETDHDTNKIRKDDSFCDILSSKPMHTDDGGLHG